MHVTYRNVARDITDTDVVYELGEVRDKMIAFLVEMQLDRPPKGYILIEDLNQQPDLNNTDDQFDIGQDLDLDSILATDVEGERGVRDYVSINASTGGLWSVSGSDAVTDDLLWREPIITASLTVAVDHALELVSTLRT